MKITGFLFCLLLAVAVHLGLALRLDPTTGGSAAAGDEGQALVSLAATPDQVAALVAQWEAPPATAAPVAAPVAPTPPRATPSTERAMTPPPQTDQRAAPPMPSLATPTAPAQPDRQMTETAPARDAPRRSLRPAVRPTVRPAPQAEPTPPTPRTQTPQTPPPENTTSGKTTRKQPASSATSAQRASGQGGGAAAGARQQDRAATLSPAQKQSLQSRWGARIRQQIERRKRYPRAARGATGRAVVMVTVGRDGGLRGVSLAGSAGHPALDQAAVQSVRAAGRFAPAPKGLSDPSYSFRLPIGFDR